MSENSTQYETMLGGAKEVQDAADKLRWRARQRESLAEIAQATSKMLAGGDGSVSAEVTYKYYSGNMSTFVLELQVHDLPTSQDAVKLVAEELASLIRVAVCNAATKSHSRLQAARSEEQSAAEALARLLPESGGPEGEI